MSSAPAFSLRPSWRLCIVLAFNAAFLAILLLRPFSAVTQTALGDLAQVIGPLLAIAFTLPAVFSQKHKANPARHTAICLLAGVFFFAAGQSIWAWYELVLHKPTPFPSIADIGFTAAYLFLFLGILRLPSRPLPTLARYRILLDSVTSMAALVTFSWYFILAPLLSQGSQSTLGKALGLFYPLSDLALLFCVLLLAGGRALPGTKPAILTLCAGLLSIIAIDTTFAAGTLHNLYSTGGPLDFLWPTGYMLLALAAHHLLTNPHAKSIPEPDAAQPQGPSLLQSLLPYAFMPPAIALLCFVYGVGGWNLRTYGVYGGASALALLVLARQFFVVCENERLYRRLEATNKTLLSLATTDSMTGLANHRAFQDRLRHELAVSQRTGQPLSLVLLDVDHFKSFNDTFGHPAGDEVLRLVAAALSASVREIDLPARYGGEEFAILLPNTTPDAAFEIAERVRTSIAATPCPHRTITASLGIATTAIPLPPSTLIKSADTALYASKSQGRNQTTAATHTAAAAV